MKGDPGKVYIYRYIPFKGVEYHEYNNEEYIEEYEERAKQLQLRNSSNTSRKDTEDLLNN